MGSSPIGPAIEIKSLRLQNFKLFFFCGLGWVGMDEMDVMDHMDDSLLGRTQPGSISSIQSISPFLPLCAERTR